MRNASFFRFGGTLGIRPVLQMTPEALLALLRTHQDGVYTVCLHVLRNPHDAEDAAQEALLKVASGAKDLREPRALKSWLYRLVYRTAVDHLRRRDSRRRIEEGSAAMTVAPLPDDARDAMQEAMAALPDDDRLMLVEHYFEKVPIEELGRREGISDVAMGKRMEKAREKLRRGLAGAGFALGLPQLANALESVTRATAPPGLVGAAVGSKAALLAAGGAAVSFKSSMIGLAALLILLLAVGGGLYYWRSGPQSPGPTRNRSFYPEAAPPRTADGTHAASLKARPSGRGDPQACRRLVARALPALRSNDMAHFAWLFACGSDRGSPEINGFVGDFMDSAGSDLIPIAKEILGEAQSDSLRFLMIVALGRSGNVQALELLKELAGEQSSVHVAASAIHSIGQIRSAESFEFLRAQMDRVREKSAAMALPVLVAMGLQGPRGLEALLAEARNAKSGTVASYQGSPWSFSFGKSDCLALARGRDLFEELKTILESEEDPEIREGAASAMARDLAPGQVETLGAYLDKSPNDGFTCSVIYSLVAAREDREAWESTRGLRSNLADRILTDTPYPSGNPQLDRALIHLGGIASPEKADPVFERFMALYSQSRNIELSLSVGEVIAAYATRPDAKSRITALVESTLLTEEQRGFVTLVALQKAPPEIAAALIKPVLEIVRKSHPAEDRFENGLIALVHGTADERLLSAAIQEVYERFSSSSDRTLLFQKLTGYSDRTGSFTIPRTFFDGLARRAPDVESVLVAAQGLFATRAGIDSEPVLRLRIAEWIGRDMKWASHAPEDGLVSDVAPEAVGDYYSRFGVSTDVPWLVALPDTFPYPADWSTKQRLFLKLELTQESRRAVDAIRLKN
jgi:RNA polymerase sigma-70 factor (ECF subfamily)